MDRRRLGLLATGLLVVGSVAACGGSDDEDATASSTTGSSTTTEATSTTVTAPPTSESVTTTAKAAGEANVALDFTGTYVLQVNGQYGECTGAGGVFGFSMTDDDVGGIGEGFSVEQIGSTDGEIEWVIDDNNAYESSPGATLTFSAGGTSVEIADDLAGAADRPERVSGTITCP